MIVKLQQSIRVVRQVDGTDGAIKTHSGTSHIETLEMLLKTVGTRVSCGIEVHEIISQILAQRDTDNRLSHSVTTDDVHLGLRSRAELVPIGMVNATRSHR